MADRPDNELTELDLGLARDSVPLAFRKILFKNLSVEAASARSGFRNEHYKSKSYWALRSERAISKIADENTR